MEEYVRKDGFKLQSAHNLYDQRNGIPNKKKKIIIIIKKVEKENKKGKWMSQNERERILPYL